ncbi:MAG: enoyl-CoA hydratase/isomerase family protein [Promethearchaeota archaeon]
MSEDFGEYIDFAVKKRFGIITLNRIHRSNAFTIEQLRNLRKAVIYCQENDKIRGLILTNNGNSFSTGMDLDFIDGSDHAAVKDLEATAAEICLLLWNGKPAIAAVNGRCMGEGAVFMICCDYRIATKNSYFYMPEILSGIFPGTGCVILFSKLIGIPWTKKMLMFAEKVPSRTALNINLIDKVVDSNENLMETALKKARFLSTKNQTVLNAIKLCANHLADKDYVSAYKIEQLASSWFQYPDKTFFIDKLRKLLNE